MVAVVAIVLLLAFFFFVPFSQSFIVPNQAGFAGGKTTIHTSLSCQAFGIGEASFSGLQYVGNQWSNNCESPSQMTIPNSRHINGTITLHDFPELTTITTVTRTTLPVGGSTYFTTTGEYAECIPPIQCYPITITTTTWITITTTNSTVKSGQTP